MGKRLVDFPPKLEEAIKEYADEKFNGNFTATVLHLIYLGLEKK